MNGEFVDLKNPPRIVPGLIVVDGPIGAGKTTFIGHLAAELRQAGATVKVIGETIPENLEEYYRKPDENVFEFQKKFLLTLFDNWRDLYGAKSFIFRENDFVICDRYWASTRAFVRYHKDRGNITDAEYRQLTDAINLFIAVAPLFPEYYVFVDEAEKTCYERICARGRPGEDAVGPEHFQEVNEYIRRHNAFPFFGENTGEIGQYNKLLSQSEYLCPHQVLARFAQRVKCVHFTRIETNTTKGKILPELSDLHFSAELVKETPLTTKVREFLTEEAAIVVTTNKKAASVFDLRNPSLEKSVFEK